MFCYKDACLNEGILPLPVAVARLGIRVILTTMTTAHYNLQSLICKLSWKQKVPEALESRLTTLSYT
jgi:hypothetical protein